MIAGVLAAALLGQAESPLVAPEPVVVEANPIVEPAPPEEDRVLIIDAGEDSSSPASVPSSEADEAPIVEDAASPSVADAGSV
jgi:hypothetical protein